MATLVGRLFPLGPVMLLDIGTTTTDIVPILNGRPDPRGHTDFDRLHVGELVYTGWRRTPVCALLHGLAAEVFATTHDCCLIFSPGSRG